jgi:hypothetical protein
MICSNAAHFKLAQQFKTCKERAKLHCQSYTSRELFVNSGNDEDPPSSSAGPRRPELDDACTLHLSTCIFWHLEILCFTAKQEKPSFMQSKQGKCHIPSMFNSSEKSGRF